MVTNMLSGLNLNNPENFQKLQKKIQMKQQKNPARALSIFTILFGLGAVGSGIGSLMGLSNPSYSAITITNAITLDNNLRFYSGLWVTLGLASLWVASRLKQEQALFRCIFIAVFIGGFGRILSMIFAGSPPPEFIAYAAIELIGAPMIIYWHYRVCRE